MATVNNDVFWRLETDKIQLLRLRSPNYQNAHMIVSRRGYDAFRITFAVGPSGLSETRVNNKQLSRTSGGWFAQNTGPSPIQLSLSGYMLDVEGYLEKHQFLMNWARFLEDKRDSTGTFENEYSCRLIIAGRQYYGYASTITISSSGNQYMLHQYQLQFIATKDEYIYRPDELSVDISSGTYQKRSVERTITDNIYNILRQDSLSSAVNSVSAIGLSINNIQNG